MKIGIMSSQNNASTPGGGGFVLSDLFPGSEAGAALDMYTTNSGMWQDTAGTTQSEAVNDPIRRVDDVSGNGNNATYAGTTPFQLAGSAGAWYAQTQGSDDRLDVTGVPATSYWVVVMDSQSDASAVTIWTGGSAFAGVMQNGSGSSPHASFGSVIYTINGNNPTSRGGIYTELTTGAQPKMFRMDGVTAPAATVFLSGYTSGSFVLTAAIRGVVYRDTAFTVGELANIAAYFDAN